MILGWLADGSLNVTTVRMLRPVLTPENHLAVLTEARRRSKKEVEVIVGAARPEAGRAVDDPEAPRPCSRAAAPTLPQAEDGPAPPPPVAPPPRRSIAP